MEITVYDRYLNRKGTVENHTSLQWRRKLYECGTFELHAPATEHNLKLLAPGNVITHGDKKEAAVIRGMTNEESTEVNEIVRTGLFLPVYFNDRLTGSMFNFNGLVEVAMRQLITRASAIPLLELADPVGFTEMVEFQATYKNLLTYLEKLAKSAEIGYRVVPDFRNKKMVFETFKGVDRTVAQGKQPRVVFSESYNNLNQVKYIYNDELYKTKAVIGGTGEGATRIYTQVGGGSGFDLREVFVDAKDINGDNLTSAEYIAALQTRGNETLAESGITENFESEAEADVNFTYKENYDLGDVVTVKKKSWSMAKNLRITELCEVYEYGGMYVVPTFGDALPEKIKWDE